MPSRYQWTNIYAEDDDDEYGGEDGEPLEDTVGGASIGPKAAAMAPGNGTEGAPNEDATHACTLSRCYGVSRDLSYNDTNHSNNVLQAIEHEKCERGLEVLLLDHAIASKMSGQNSALPVYDLPLADSANEFPELTEPLAATSNVSDIPISRL